MRGISFLQLKMKSYNNIYYVAHCVYNIDALQFNSRGLGAVEVCGCGLAVGVASLGAGNPYTCETHHDHQVKESSSN